MIPEQMANDPIPTSGTFGNSFLGYELTLSNDLQDIINFTYLPDEIFHPTELI